jgi:hypothetical protein
LKSIEECLKEAERALSDNRLKGHNPLWSPRLIEAVRYAVKGMSDRQLLEVGRILDGRQNDKYKT